MSVRKETGFTLIELMIVVTVIAILAAVAYPSYQAQVRKGRMGQAQADLLELSQFMERCFASNNSYQGCALPFSTSPRNGTPYYQIEFNPATTRTEFNLRAVPQTAGGQDKQKCGTLELNQSGVKRFGALGTQADCW
ncbi:type IV pilin protein [Silanimonas sp.]|uniref:type IV pilin protein n=1 Tax=Silanimonas sp. TaxID=1929290 RepID=UPI0022C655A2|nr:type IV pilin protein [Silanimonas sp.]MCZ8164822.1 type IV pilin protein [Silanimonas sp.]